MPRVILITGGTSGIGFEAALLFRKEGDKVFVIGRSEEKGRSAEKRGLTYIRGDVSDPSITQIVREVGEREGRIDVLVNAAGVYRGGNLESFSLEEWNEVIGVNLTGTFLVTKAALPYMGEGSVIINVSSTAGVSPYPRGTAYCASKAGVIAFSRALALELAPRGIRVNVVAPGLTDTPMLRGIAGSEERMREFAQLVPLKRIASPEEVARLIHFLASEGASYITGAVFVIDGGMTAGRTTTAGSIGARE